jgi:hypothetical protein
MAAASVTLRWLVPMMLLCLAIAPCRAQIVIDSLDGPVTGHEVDSVITYASSLAIPYLQYDATSTHNNLADGKWGTVLEGLNDLYGVTRHNPALRAEGSRLLDLAIEWTDTWLVHRNDMPLGEQRVMWTGNVEPVWPPNCPTCDSSTYYESEVGDTIGHMAQTAFNILSTPRIWFQRVPDGDPNHFGVTYLERARTYISMLEYSLDRAFTPYFIDPATLTIHRPSVALGYLDSFHNVNAWNVEMMLINAYWRLALCHEILRDAPERAERYRTIVENTVNLFVQNAVPSTAVDGTPVYDWGYGNFGDVLNRLTGEQIGIHGQYDILGLTRAYFTRFTNATREQMKIYADTVVHEMTLSVDGNGAATYAGYNDRCCSTQTYNYLPTGFIFLTPFNADIFKPAATADINSGRVKGGVGIAAGILWAKDWLFRHAGCSHSINANTKLDERGCDSW